MATLIFMFSVSPIAGSTNSIYFLVIALIPWIAATSKIVQVQAHLYNLGVREKLLEIELRLAEMNEKLDKGQG